MIEILVTYDHNNGALDIYLAEDIEKIKAKLAERSECGCDIGCDHVGGTFDEDLEECETLLDVYHLIQSNYDWLEIEIKWRDYI